MRDAIGRLGDRLALPTEEMIALGRNHPGDHDEPFGVTQAALRMSCAANGVSRRHGEVSREMWASLWRDGALDEVPIGHVTNGVHVPTWIGTPMRELLGRHLGEDFLDAGGRPGHLGAGRGDPGGGAVAVRAGSSAPI